MRRKGNILLRLQKYSQFFLIPSLLLIFSLQLEPESTFAQTSIMTPGGADPTNLATVVDITTDQATQIAGTTFNIDGGTTVGQNLFHSFTQFSVGSEHTANFISASGTANILSRVTGGTLSQIDGSLKVTGSSANLFLLNPAGIMFGAGAELNLNGAFIATTANSIGLDGGINFDMGTTIANLGALVTANPVDFKFVGASPAGGIDLASLVTNGAEVVVVGRDVGVTAGVQISGNLISDGGKVTIASVKNAVTVPFDLAMDTIINLFTGGGTGPALAGTIAVGDGAKIDTSGSAAAGRLVLRGGKLVMDNADLVANTTGDTSGHTIAIDIRLSDELTMSNGSTIMTSTDGKAIAGGIQIKADTVNVDGSTISSTSTLDDADAGAAGDIVIEGTNSPATEVTLNNATEVSTNIDKGKAGTDKANITVDATTLNVNGTTKIETKSGDVAPAGDIILKANNVTESAGSTVSSGGDLRLNFTSGSGNKSFTSAKAVTIEGGGLKAGMAQSLLTEHESIFDSATQTFDFDNGDDNFTLDQDFTLTDATNALTLKGKKLELKDSTFQSTNSPGASNGSFTFRVEDLTFRNSTVSASGTGTANSGSFTANKGFDDASTPDKITIEDSLIKTDVAGGTGGDITIKTTVLNITNPGGKPANEVGVQTNSGTGMAGDLTVQASTTTVNDAPISSTSTGGGAGELKIEGTAEGTAATKVELKNATVSTKTNNTAGGALTVKAATLDLQDGTIIKTETDGTADAGKIDLLATILLSNSKADDQVLGGNPAKVTVQSTGMGGSAAGAITIKGTGAGAADKVTAYGTLVKTTTVNMDGGAIKVEATTLKYFGDNEDKANVGIQTNTTGTGKAGDITLQSTNATITDVTISSSSTTSGAAGEIKIEGNSPAQSVKLDNAMVSTTVKDGEGADVTVTATNLTLKPGTTVETKTTGDGNAGDVKLQTTTLLSNYNDAGDTPLSGVADVTVQSISDGDGKTGAITIGGTAGGASFATDLSASETTIQTKSMKDGLGNVIDIKVSSTIILDDSEVVATADNFGTIPNDSAINLNVTVLDDGGTPEDEAVGNPQGTLALNGSSSIHTEKINDIAADTSDLIGNVTKIEAEKGTSLSATGKVRLPADVEIEATVGATQDDDGDLVATESIDFFFVLNGEAQLFIELGDFSKGEKSQFIVYSPEKITNGLNFETIETVDFGNVDWIFVAPELDFNGELNNTGTLQFKTDTSTGNPAGNFIFQTEKLTVNDTQFTSTTSGAGAGGSFIFEEGFPGVDIIGNEITLTSTGPGDTATFTDSSINVQSTMSGQPGLIDIEVEKSIEITNSRFDASVVDGAGPLSSPDLISLKASTIQIKDSIFDLVTNGTSDGGNLKMIATGSDINAVGLGFTHAISISDTSDGFFTWIGTYTGNSARGKGGTVDIEAANGTLNLDDITIDGGSFFAPFEDIVCSSCQDIGDIGDEDFGIFAEDSEFLNGLPGRGGSIDLRAKNINIKDGKIWADSFGPGAGGKVSFNAEEVLTLDQADIQNTSRTRFKYKVDVGGGVFQNIAGAAGNTEMTANKIVFKNNTVVTADSFGLGNAGDFILNANEFQMFDSHISNSGFSFDPDAGNAGSIFLNGEINMDSKITLERTVFQAVTRRGVGGAINFLADEIDLKDNTSLTTSSTGGGKAGKITLKGDTITVTDTTISSSSDGGDGAAGEIVLEGTASPANFIRLNDTDITTTIAGGDGDTDEANIKIAAKTVSLENETEIKADTTGAANAGTISLEATKLFSNMKVDDATGNVELDGDGNPQPLDPGEDAQVVISSGSKGVASGAAGNISTKNKDGDDPSTPDIVVLNKTKIETDAEATGAGGSITLGAGGSTPAVAGEIPLQLMDTTVSASVHDHKGTETASDGSGEITLTAPAITVTGGQIATDTSGTRDAGRIRFQTGALETINSTIPVALEGGGTTGVLISSSTGVDVAGAAGDVLTQAEEDETVFPTTVRLTDTTIQTNSRGTGAGGRIALGTLGSTPAVAGEIPLQLLDSTVTASVNNVGGGDGLGEITLTAPAITVTGGKIATDTGGTRDAGRIRLQTGALETINSTIPVPLEGGGTTGVLISSSSTDEVAAAAGAAGGVLVQAEDDENSFPTTVRLTNTTIQTNAKGTGAGGRIALRALGSTPAVAGEIPLQLLDSTVTASVNNVGGGDGLGEITLTAPAITVTGGKIATDTGGTRDAGRIRLQTGALETINSTIPVDLDDMAGGPTTGVLISNSSTDEVAAAAGAAGDVLLQAEEDETSFPATVRLTNTTIQTNSRGTGAGGRIALGANGTDTVGEIPLQLLDSTVTASVNNVGGGDGLGEITLTAPAITVTGGKIATDTGGTRDAGRIRLQTGALETINSTIPVPLEGVGTTGVLISSSSTDEVSAAAGAAGGVLVQAEDDEDSFPTTVRLTNTTIQTNSRGTGAGGRIALGANGTDTVGEISLQLMDTTVSASVHDHKGTETASDGLGVIEVTAPAMTMTRVDVKTDTDGTRDAGEITFNVDRLTMIGENNEISSSSTSPNPDAGGAGSILLEGTASPAELIRLNGAKVSTTIVGGNAGTSQANIKIFSDLLSLENGTEIKADTSGGGPGGNITLVGGTVLSNAELDENGMPQSLDGVERVTISSNSSGAGPGGTISIDADTKLVLDATRVSASTSGSGSGGSIKIESTSTLNPEDMTFGNEQLLLQHDTVISAESTGAGNAGEITIASVDTMRLRDTQVTTKAESSSGGGISVFANYLIHLINSLIESSVLGNSTTQGGNIVIDPQFLILQNSQILATATSGFGGNISITAGVFLNDAFSNISASSQFGVDGVISIDSPVQSLSGAIAPLPEDIIEVADLFNARCAAQKGGAFSSFTLGGQDSLPTEPGDFIPTPLQLNGVEPFGVDGASNRPLTAPVQMSSGGNSQVSTLMVARTFPLDGELVVFNSGCHSS